MKVWLVSDYRYDDSEVVAVFSSKVEAQRYANLHEYDVEEHDVLDEAPDEVKVWTAAGTLTLATGEVRPGSVRSQVVSREEADRICEPTAEPAPLPTAAMQLRYTNMPAVYIEVKPRRSEREALEAFTALAQQAASYIVGDAVREA